MTQLPKSQALEFMSSAVQPPGTVFLARKRPRGWSARARDLTGLTVLGLLLFHRRLVPADMPGTTCLMPPHLGVCSLASG